MFMLSKTVLHKGKKLVYNTRCLQKMGSQIIAREISQLVESGIYRCKDEIREVFWLPINYVGEVGPLRT